MKPPQQSRQSRPQSRLDALRDRRLQSPSQHWQDYGEFPVKALLILVVAALATLVLGVKNDNVQEEDLQEQNFFNFHLLGHGNPDMYIATNLLNIPQQEYLTLQDIHAHFRQQMDTLRHLNRDEFVPEYDNDLLASHPQNLSLHFRNKTGTVFHFTLRDGLPQLTDLGLLKHLLNQVHSLTLDYWLSDLRSLRVEYKVSAYSVTALVEQRSKTRLDFGQLRVRKPVVQHTNIMLKEAAFLFAHLLCALALAAFQYFQLRWMVQLYDSSIKQPNLNWLLEQKKKSHQVVLKEYENRTAKLEDEAAQLDVVLRSGVQFNLLNARDASILLGRWNIANLALGSLLALVDVFLLLSSRSFVVLSQQIGLGAMCIFSWLLLLSLVDSLKHYFRVTTIVRRGFSLASALLLGYLPLLLGVVLAFQLSCGTLARFQSLYPGAFFLLYNHFLYGIYQNFIDLSKVGLVEVLVYVVFLLLGVEVLNNMMISFFAEIMRERQRQRSVLELVRQLAPLCPRCQHLERPSQPAPALHHVAGFTYSCPQDPLFIRAVPGQVISSPNIRMPSPEQAINLSPYSIEDEETQVSAVRVLAKRILRPVVELEVSADLAAKGRDRGLLVDCAQRLDRLVARVRALQA